MPQLKGPDHLPISSLSQIRKKIVHGRIVTLYALFRAGAGSGRRPGSCPAPAAHQPRPGGRAHRGRGGIPRPPRRRAPPIGRPTRPHHIRLQRINVNHQRRAPH